MCPPTPLSSDPGCGGLPTGRGGVGGTGVSAHTPPSLEEIEKKLNIYHKGAKIWKMLIFCQVGFSPFLLGVEWGHRWGMCSLCAHVNEHVSVGWGSACMLSVCAPRGQLESPTGRPRTPLPAQEQGGHLCQSGEGRGHDPVSGQGCPGRLGKESWAVSICTPHPHSPSA